jgi:excisionase family DNA binding protein
MPDARTEQVSFEWTASRAGEAAPPTVPASPRASPPVRATARRTARRTAPGPHLASGEPRSRWLTAHEATAYLGFPTRKALYAAVERGQVPARKLGRRLRFNQDELDALLGGRR